MFLTNKSYDLLKEKSLSVVDNGATGTLIRICEKITKEHVQIRAMLGAR